MKARLQSQSIYRRVLASAVLAGLGSLLVPGCESRGATESQTEISRAESFSGDALDKELQESAEAEEPAIRYEEGPKPQPQTVLARGKGLEITLEDYERSVHRSLLFAPPKEDGSRYLEVPADRLAAPQLQSLLVESLLENAIVKEEAKRRGLNCSPEDVRKQLASQRQLERFGVMFAEEGEAAEHPALVAELATLRMTPEDVREVACEDVLRKKVQAALLADIDEAELWAAYQNARNTVDLLLVAVNNTPSSAEIDAFLAQDQARQESQIEAHFVKYPERYMLPRMARLTMLKAPVGQGGPEVVEKLQQAVHRLSSGEEPAAIASGLGLVLESDSELQVGENPRVFGQKVGGTGIEMEGPRGSYAWRLEEIREPSKLELTRPLRREIAAELLRQDGVLESVQQKLQPALEAMKAMGSLKAGESLSEEKVEALREKLAEHGLKLQRTTAFSRSPQGFIPGVGLAEEVVEAAFDLRENKPTMDTLVASRERVFAFRLAARERPTRAGFQKEKNSFRKGYLDGRSDRIVQDLVSAKLTDAELTVDLSALRIKYGVLAKEK